MKSKFLSATKYVLILAVALFVAGLTPAHADSIFDLTGTMTGGRSFTGTMSVNTATGVIDSGSFTITSGFGSITYTMLTLQLSGTGFAVADFGNIDGTALALYSATSPSGSAGSLIGYTGGALCSQTAPCGIAVSGISLD